MIEMISVMVTHHMGMEGCCRPDVRDVHKMRYRRWGGEQYVSEKIEGVNQNRR